MIKSLKIIEGQIQAQEALIEWAKNAKRELVNNSPHLREAEFTQLRRYNSYIFNAEEKLEQLRAERVEALRNVSPFSASLI